MRVQKVIQQLWERVFDSPNDYNTLSGFSYYAFISYTEKDEKWAEWLQWNLEHYQIPIKVRNERRDLPAKVKPVFWYKNDLAGAHLSGAINKELEQSKYMIVVCSPTSAKKEWVNEEVRYFKDTLGRDENIIPFIVDGEINAVNAEQECLPLSIRNLPREKELRGIDVRLYGKSKALVNIVSTLFDIRFDILWNRFKRERQRRFVIYSAIFVLCAFGLFGCWDYFLHTKYEYYVDADDCNGIPTGIIRVNNDEAKKHYRLYRFEYRRRMLQRVVYVDGDGNPQNPTNTELIDRPCIQDLSYSDGDISAINCKDATFKTMYIMHLSKDKLAADLKDEDENQAANFIFSSTSVDQGQSLFQNMAFLDMLLTSPSKIARYVYERDDAGYITKKMFARHNGDNDDIGIDANGISGFEYERDSLHRIVRIRFLDAHGEYSTNNLGVAGKKYQYDQHGNLTVAEYVDKNGKLIYNEHHWAKSVDIYDKYGYCLEGRVYGADGKPCISFYGFHKIMTKYEDNKETLSLYDIHDHPTYTMQFGNDPGGYSCITTIRNHKGQVVEVQFKDSNGELCYNLFHVAIMRLEYNDVGLIACIRNYGTDNNPCSNIEGYSYECISYNPQGFETEHSYYNGKGLPAYNSEGIHRICMQYDNTGRRMVEAHVFNTEKLPCTCYTFDGAAWVKLAYRGSSRWVSELSFYSGDNKPFETRAGAKVCCERDPYGQITSYKFYNEKYELSSNDTHCAIGELEYNRMGKETERRFYDENKRPMLLTGLFRISKSYNNTGQVERICCYDTLQQLHPCTYGWAIQEFNYSNGAICANSFYNEREEPIEIGGIHKNVYEFDDSGNMLSRSAYNKLMQPTTDSTYSAYKVVCSYDDKRRPVREEYYDTKNSEPFVCVEYRFNPRGQLLERTAYNAHKELVDSPLNFGVAKYRTEFDSQDRKTYICSTNHRGEKENSSYGFAEAYMTYENNYQEAVFLNSEQKPVNNVSLIEPCAYAIMYLTDMGQRLYSKRVILSFDGKYKTIREAFCYDLQGQNVQKEIRCDDDQVIMFDVPSNLRSSYFSIEKEYADLVHVVDSIQHTTELKYGMPKLYHYLTGKN